MYGLSKRARKIRNRLLLIAAPLLFVIFISGSTQLTDLQRVYDRGQLVMLTLPGPTTYYEDGRGQNGFDYLIAKAFADSLDVELMVKPQLTLHGLLRSVSGAKGDFAAANLTITEDRGKSLEFSIPYMDVTQQLIYRRGEKRPKSLDLLAGELVVITGSSHSEQLIKLKGFCAKPNLVGAR
tara:strand:- start:4 stop:546 length:543 start_codon:yes stop_codon:yes gene_type:complete